MMTINDDMPKIDMPLLLAWWKRRALSREMQSLEDRLLADIGVERHDIEAIAANSFPKFSLAARLSRMAEKLKRVHDNHVAAWELSAFDDHMLNDIGLFRSDLSGIAKGRYPERRSAISNHVERADDISFEGLASNDDHRRAA